MDRCKMSKAAEGYKRSNHLLEAQQSVLVVVDVQEKFRKVISGMNEVVAKCSVLRKAADKLGVPVVFTEQYPKALGSTLPELAPNNEIHPKRCFSGGDCETFVQKVQSLDRKQVVITGVETHVCVLQTAFDLHANIPGGAYVVTDATSSRKDIERERAFNRMQSGGISCVTTEMVLFEWMRTSESSEFKEIQKLII